MKKKTGKIIPHGVRLEKHEYDTVLFFTNLGLDIELITPSTTKGLHSADIIMNGKSWEIKSPQGESKRTIERLLNKATRQSQNVVIDLRRSKVPTNISVKTLEKEFRLRKSIKRLKIITKTEDLLDFSR